jgi:hypothetical protein
MIQTPLSGRPIPLAVINDVSGSGKTLKRQWGFVAVESDRRTALPRNAEAANGRLQEFHRSNPEGNLIEFVV